MEMGSLTGRVRKMENAGTLTLLLHGRHYIAGQPDQTRPKGQWHAARPFQGVS